MSDNKKKGSQRTKTQRITPKNKNDSDAEPQQREIRGGRGGCRAVKAAGDVSKTEEGESQTVITRQHEVLSNTLQGGNSKRNEEESKRKGN